jgi:hypothetical protein
MPLALAVERMIFGKSLNDQGGLGARLAGVLASARRALLRWE